MSSTLLMELARPRTGLRLLETSTLDDLDSAARELASSADAARVPIVLAGGDGSYMAGISALVQAFGATGHPLPPVAFAPGGTACTVARNWGGLAGDPAAHAARLLDGIAAGAFRPRPRPTLRVRADGRDRVGFIVGSGLVTRFFEAYEAGGAEGYGAAAQIVARIFAGSFAGSRFARSILDPMPCRVEVDGTAAPFDRVSLICASVVRDLGIGMRLLYRAGESFDRFHVVATPLAARTLGPQLPLVLAGRPLLGPKVDALARKVTLRFPDDAGAYVLDGDLFRAGSIEIAAGPTLELLAP